ncbi:uncharacterized protein LOC121690019 isoform X2 [Alosa sapidissima]|uniref:uncharacterized protein LOC121690019 isoform X2 n=1 Tax=Alosa sapidissima TaxID=34773 RepID=UPI001C090D89|nr:uncharacterized protein LOC121690019 isoform X2 [Alosa sapidissima]
MSCNRQRHRQLQDHFNRILDSHISMDGQDNTRNVVDRLRDCQRRIDPHRNARTTRSASRALSSLRLCFLTDPSAEVLGSRNASSITKTNAPFSMSETDFRKKVKDTFPDLQDGDFDLCRVDRWRKVHPVGISSLCPSVITACPEFSRSAVYIRLKTAPPPSGQMVDQITPPSSGQNVIVDQLMAWRALRQVQDQEYASSLEIDRARDMRRRQI